MLTNHQKKLLDLLKRNQVTTLEDILDLSWAETIQAARVQVSRLRKLNYEITQCRDGYYMPECHTLTPEESLTSKEFEVFQYLKNGSLLVVDLMAKMEMSERGLSTHIWSIKKKLGSKYVLYRKNWKYHLILKQEESLVNNLEELQHIKPLLQPGDIYYHERATVKIIDSFKKDGREFVEIEALNWRFQFNRYTFSKTVFLQTFRPKAYVSAA